MTPWHLGRMGAFDLETTGVDVDADRIVTATVTPVGGGAAPEPREWILDPGIEIPEGATAVHGITTEQARAEGIEAARGVDEITAALAKQLAFGVPIVGHNIGGYDLTLLDRECRRHHLPTLLDRYVDDVLWPVIDTAVLDKHALPYRKRVSETQGARQLITLAQVYGFPWDAKNAHGCTYDALQSARIAWRIGSLAHTPREQWPEHIATARRPRFADFAGLDLEALHHLQSELAPVQAADLQAHFRKTDPAAVVDGTWPLRPWGDS